MHRSNQRGFGTLRCLLVTLGLIGLAASALAGDPVRWSPSDLPNVEPGTPIPDHFVAESVVNLGTDPFGITYSDATYDCGVLAYGFGQRRFDFTLTATAHVRIEVNDCCIAGDLYEGRTNNRTVDEDLDGNPNNHEEDKIVGAELVDIPVGVYANVGETDLAAGQWTIRIRDRGFQCSPTYAGCPAGYTVRLTFMAPTGSEPCIESCTSVAGTRCASYNPSECVTYDGSVYDESLCSPPPSTGDCDLGPIEAKLDDEFRFTDDDELREFRDEINAQLAALEAKLDDMATGLCDVVRLLHTPSGIREADCGGVHYDWNADGTFHD